MRLSKTTKVRSTFPRILTNTRASSRQTRPPVHLQRGSPTCSVVEDVGPLQALLHVLLPHHHGPKASARGRHSLDGQLQPVEPGAGVSVTQVGYGVQSRLLDEHLGPGRNHSTGGRDITTSAT